MTVSNQPSSLLDSVLTAETTQQDAGVTVLRKAEDQVKQQGQAMCNSSSKPACPPTACTSTLTPDYAVFAFSRADR
jgi:hypothetical protein